MTEKTAFLDENYLDEISQAKAQAQEMGYRACDLLTELTPRGVAATWAIRFTNKTTGVSVVIASCVNNGDGGAANVRFATAEARKAHESQLTALAPDKPEALEHVCDALSF